MVWVREGYRKPELEGMSGIIEQCWGSPDYVALDVRLENGRSELFWFHQLDIVEEAGNMRLATTAFYEGS